MVVVLEIVVEADDVLVLERAVDGDLLADLLFLVGLLELRFGDNFACEYFFGGHVLQFVALGKATLLVGKQNEIKRVAGDRFGNR